jgi:hypothetical protein
MTEYKSDMDTDKMSLTKKETLKRWKGIGYGAKSEKYPHLVDCSSKRSFISDINEDALFADGFDNAIVGYDASSYCVVYDYDKCLKVLMENDDRMSYPDAHEFMEFNVVGAYVGDFTPIFVHSLV